MAASAPVTSTPALCFGKLRLEREERRGKGGERCRWPGALI